MAEYTKLKAQDDQLAADIKELENAPDHHTVDNRGKRRALQGQRDEVAKVQSVIGENIRQGQRAMQNLFQSVETNLALAEFAQTWEWKEAEAQPGMRRNGAHADARRR
jgi:predicted  nucleic acid-binding Zn-ribbon protein